MHFALRCRGGRLINGHQDVGGSAPKSQVQPARRRQVVDIFVEGALNGVLFRRTSSPVVCLLLLSSSSVLVARVSCLSHICHRLVADQLLSGYLLCLSRRSVLVEHLLSPPYLSYVAAGTRLPATNPARNRRCSETARSSRLPCVDRSAWWFDFPKPVFETQLKPGPMGPWRYGGRS